MKKISLTVGAVILIVSAFVLLVEWDFETDFGECCSCSADNILSQKNNPNVSPSPALSTRTSPISVIPSCPSPQTCPACTPCSVSNTEEPLHDPHCQDKTRSIVEQVCFDPQGSTTVEVVHPALSMQVKIPERSKEQKLRYTEDENRFIANREVFWINGSPFIPPPEVLRIDTYNLGPGKRSSIRVAHWNHGCNTWYNSKIDLSASFLTVPELDRWAALIRPGSVAIDIGAHVGDTTVPIAVAADMTIAFEPMKTAYPVTWTNGIVNPLLNIHTHNMAVGAVQADLMWSYDCNGGADSFDPSYSFPVKMVVLYDFLKQNYPEDVIRNISLIKIDTEGHDMDIVQTLGPLFNVTKQKPIIFAEWFYDFQWNNQQRERYQTVATEMGFVLFSPAGVRIRDMLSALYCRDLVFVPKEMEEFWASGQRMQPTTAPSPSAIPSHPPM